MSNKNKNGIIAVIVVLLILSLLAGALALMTDGYKNWNVSTWFVPDETEKTKPAQDNGFVVGDTSENGVTLKSACIASADYAKYGISPLAETAYTINATITPATADNKAVDWSVSWVNALSAWANGKTVTQYVTVTPASDGSLTATASCLQAFGEQIRLTCTSRDKPTISASTSVDYRVRATEVTFEADGKRYTDSPAEDIIAAEMSYYFKPGVELGTGTINDYTYSYSVNVRFTNAFADYMTKHNCEKFDYPHFDEAYGTGYNLQYTIPEDEAEHYFDFYLSKDTLIEMNLTYPNNQDGSAFSGVEEDINCFIDGLKHYTGSDGVFLFEVTASCNENSNVWVYAEFSVGLNPAALIVSVEDMTLDSDGLIF